MGLLPYWPMVVFCQALVGTCGREARFLGSHGCREENETSHRAHGTGDPNRRIHGTASGIEVVQRQRVQGGRRCLDKGETSRFPRQGYGS